MSKREYELLDKSNFDFLLEPEKQDINQDILIQDNKELEEEKKLLIYKAQSISIFKIIYHLSVKLEIFFIIFGTLCTAFSGCTNALWGLIIGNISNELTIIIGADNSPMEEYI